MVSAKRFSCRVRPFALDDRPVEVAFFESFERAIEFPFLYFTVSNPSTLCHFTYQCGSFL